MVESAGTYVYLPDARTPPMLEQVGGKALGLSRLQRLGCEVPAWFALTADAFGVSHQGRADAGEVAPEVMAEVEAAVRQLELSGGYLAVRSSATCRGW